MSYSKKMLTALSEGDLAQATVFFNEAKEHDLSEEKLQLADNLFQLGFLEESGELYQLLLNEFPNEDTFKISLAEIAVEENEIETAFEWLEQILPKSDVYAQSLLTTADIYQMLGIPEVSEAKLREAKKALPNEPLIDLALAELFFANESYAQAIDIYNDIETRYKEFDSPINLAERQGVSYSRIGEFEKAVVALEQATTEGETPEALFQLALTYYQLGENERSITMLERVKEISSDFTQVYYPLAQILYDEGRHEEALETAEEGIAVNPYETSLYHVASESAYQMNLKEDARGYLEEVISLEAESDVSKLKLAEFLTKEEEYEEVIEIVSTLDNEEQGLAYWYLAQAYNGLEEYDKANLNYQKASLFLIDEADFLKDYGLFLREEGNIDLSRELFIKYLNIVPDDLMIASIIESE